MPHAEGRFIRYLPARAGCSLLPECDLRGDRWHVCASLLAPLHEPTVSPWHHGVVVSFDAVFVSFPCRLSLVRPPSPVSCLARAVSLHRAHVFAPAEALSSWSALGAMAVTST